MLTSLSLDEMLLPRYVNWSTNSKGMPLRVEMAPSCLKHTNSVLFGIYVEANDLLLAPG